MAEDISDKAEDVTQVAGGLGIAANVVLVVFLFGLIAIVLDAVEDTTGVNVDITGVFDVAWDTLHTVIDSMITSIVEVLK